MKIRITTYCLILLFACSSCQTASINMEEMLVSGCRKHDSGLFELIHCSMTSSNISTVGIIYKGDEPILINRPRVTLYDQNLLALNRYEDYEGSDVVDFDAYYLCRPPSKWTGRSHVEREPVVHIVEIETKNSMTMEDVYWAEINIHYTRVNRLQLDENKFSKMDSWVQNVQIKEVPESGRVFFSFIKYAHTDDSFYNRLYKEGIYHPLISRQPPSRNQ